LGCPLCSKNQERNTSHTDSVTVKVPEVVQGFKAFENHDGYNEKYFMHIEIISPISYN